MKVESSRHMLVHSDDRGAVGHAVVKADCEAKRKSLPHILDNF